MKIKEITSFLSRIEKCLNNANISFTQIDDFYYCTNLNEKHCIIVPYISALEFELPNYKDCLNYIIVSNGDYIGTNADIKFLTIQDFENLTKYKKSKTANVDNILNLFFFNDEIFDCLNHITDANLVKNASSKNKNTIGNEKTNSLSEYSIDINSINDYLSCNLVKGKKAYFYDDLCVIPLISKLYNGKRYWYGYHDYQIDILIKYKKSYVAFFFKNRPEFLLMPKSALDLWFDKLNSTKKEGKEYWHIYFVFKDEKCLWQVPNNGYKDVSQYLVKRNNKSDNQGVLSEDSTLEKRNITQRESSELLNNKYKSDDETIIKLSSNVFHETKTKRG